MNHDTRRATPVYRFRPVFGPEDTAGVVLALFEDSAGRIWAGTDGDGLIGYPPSTGEITVVTEPGGLPNNVIYGICPDDTGGR